MNLPRVRNAHARMLVVDDDPGSRRLLEGFLLAEGYQVRCAADGVQALEAARAWRPDVVLLDVMMPGMTGHDVCVELKRDAGLRLCQVMMVTALDSTPDKVEGLDIGADDYVTKPVRREEFLAKVRALLRARRLLLELDDMRQELAARNEELSLKKTLAQSLVHDLKAPLAAILGNLDLLEMRSAKEVQHLIARTRQGGRRMLKMILNLLDVEKLEEGQLRTERKPLDAARVARQAVTEAAAYARSRQVRIELDADPGVWTDGDTGLLERVMDNLLSNAVTHTPKGSTVSVEVGQRDEGIEIVVADQGPGIPEEQRESIFEKYVRLGQSHERAWANRGLGLTFCRLAVEAHGGTIWVEPAPRGSGACFHTILPASTLSSPVEEGTVAQEE